MILSKDSATKSLVNINGVNVNSFMYVEDCCTCTLGSGFARNMNILSNYCNDWRLEINTKKQNA